MAVFLVFVPSVLDIPKYQTKKTTYSNLSTGGPRRVWLGRASFHNKLHSSGAPGRSCAAPGARGMELETRLLPSVSGVLFGFHRGGGAQGGGSRGRVISIVVFSCSHVLRSNQATRHPGADQHVV